MFRNTSLTPVPLHAQGSADYNMAHRSARAWIHAQVHERVFQKTHYHVGFVMSCVLPHKFKLGVVIPCVLPHIRLLGDVISYV